MMGRLRRLVVVGVAAATVIGLGTRAMATAVDASPAWGVTVGTASRPLFPGTDATVAYDVRNSSSAQQRLHAATAEIKNDGVGVFDTRTGHYVDDCLAQWFQVAPNDAVSDTDVAPGATVHGTLRLTLETAPESQDACQNLGLDVVVTAG